MKWGAPGPYVWPVKRQRVAARRSLVLCGGPKRQAASLSLADRGRGAGRFPTRGGGVGRSSSRGRSHSAPAARLPAFTRGRPLFSCREEKSSSHNGATGTPPAPQKVEKGKTVTLPILRASNAEFLGWGYSTDGRTLTEWKAEYPVTSDLTLYAMWETESDDLLSGLTYRFGNYHAAFGYSASYQIPKERYELVFGKVQGNTVYNNMLNKTWGGNCYGMAATSEMFFHGGGTTTSSFRTEAEVPYQLYTSDRNSTLNMNVTEYIEAVFVTQYANSKHCALNG